MWRSIFDLRNWMQGLHGYRTSLTRLRQIPEASNINRSAKVKCLKKLNVCSQCSGPCATTWKQKNILRPWPLSCYVMLIEFVRRSCCALLPSVWQHKNIEQDEWGVKACEFPDAYSQITSALQSSSRVLVWIVWLVCEWFCHCIFDGQYGHMPELFQSPALAWHRHHELCNPQTNIPVSIPSQTLKSSIMFQCSTLCSIAFHCIRLENGSANIQIR